MASAEGGWDFDKSVDQMAMPTATGVECVYETQRWFPFAGWGVKRMPTDVPVWIDAQRRELRREHVRLPEGAEWVSPWTIDSSQGDEDGWEYAGDWWWTYHGQQKKQDCVRRRRWVRGHRLADPRPHPFEIDIKTDMQLVDTGVEVNADTLVLTAVTPDSPADLAGGSRMIGNTILSINGAKFTSTTELCTASPRNDVHYTLEFEPAGGTESGIHKLFPNTLPLTETLINTFQCSLRTGTDLNIPKPGKLYLTPNFVCFWSVVIEKVVLPFSKVTKIEKAKGKVFNDVVIREGDKSHHFTGFFNLGNAFKLMTKLWQLGRERQASMSASPARDADIHSDDGTDVTSSVVNGSHCDSLGNSFPREADVGRTPPGSMPQQFPTPSPQPLSGVVFATAVSSVMHESNASTNTNVLEDPVQARAVEASCSDMTTEATEGKADAMAVAAKEEPLGATVVSESGTPVHEYTAAAARDDDEAFKLPSAESPRTPQLGRMDPGDRRQVSPSRRRTVSPQKGGGLVAAVKSKLPSKASTPRPQGSPQDEASPKASKSWMEVELTPQDGDLAHLIEGGNTPPPAGTAAKVPAPPAVPPLDTKHVERASRSPSESPERTGSPRTPKDGQVGQSPDGKLDAKGSRLRGIFRRASGIGADVDDAGDASTVQLAGGARERDSPRRAKGKGRISDLLSPDKAGRRRRGSDAGRSEEASRARESPVHTHSDQPDAEARREKSAEATWKSNDDKEAELARAFPNSPLREDEQLVETFSTSFKAKNHIDRVGTMWLTGRRILFTSSFIENFEIPLRGITSVKKKKDLVFLNAIVISTKDDAYTFTAFLQRDAAYQLINSLWNVARAAKVEPTKPVAAASVPRGVQAAGGKKKGGAGASAGAGKSAPATLAAHAATTLREASEAAHKEFPSRGEGKTAIHFSPIHNVLGADAATKLIDNAPFAKGAVIQDVYAALFADDSKFLSLYHHKRGEYSGTKAAPTKPAIPAWNNGHAESGLGARAYQCTTVVQAPWSTHTPYVEAHRFVNFTDGGTPRMVMQFTSMTPDVMYGTCFRIEVVMSIVERGGQCFISIHGMVHFMSTPFGVKGKIQNTAMGELKTSYAAFTHQAQAAVEKHMARSSAPSASFASQGSSGSGGDTAEASDDDDDDDAAEAVPAPPEAEGMLSLVLSQVLEAADPALAGKGAAGVAALWVVWSAWCLGSTLNASATALTTIAHELQTLQTCTGDAACGQHIPSEALKHALAAPHYQPANPYAVATLATLQLSIISNLFVCVALGFACCLAVLACVRK